MESGNPLNVTGALVVEAGESAGSGCGSGQAGLWEALAEAEEWLPMDLWTAASLGDVQSLKELVMRGEDVNQPNQGGWTPLHFAAYIGHKSALRFLADSGAGLETGNARGRNALMLAASCGNDGALRLLLQLRADLEAKDAHGWTALFYAATNNHVNATAALLAAGADPNVLCCPRHRLSPLHIAVTEGHQLILQALLQYGPDLALTTTAGHNVRDLARLSKAASRDKVLQTLASHRQAGGQPASARGPGGLTLTVTVPEPKPRPEEAKPRATVPPQQTKAVPAAASAAPAAAPPPPEPRKKPSSLGELLSELGIEKYLGILEEQGVDLETFLTLTDGELKEAGIRLMGPRKKMVNAIGRWAAGGLPAAVEGSWEAVALVGQLAGAKAEAERRARLASERLSSAEAAAEDAAQRLAEAEAKGRASEELLADAARLLARLPHNAADDLSALKLRLAAAGFSQ